MMSPGIIKILVQKPNKRFLSKKKTNKKNNHLI